MFHYPRALPRWRASSLPPPALLLCFPATPGDKTPGPSIPPRHCGAWDLGTAPGNAAVAGERLPPAQPAGAEPSPAAPAAPLELPKSPPRSRGAARMSPQHQPDNQGAQSRVPAPLSPRCYPTVTPTSPGEDPAGRGPHRHQDLTKTPLTPAKLGTPPSLQHNLQGGCGGLLPTPCCCQHRGWPPPSSSSSSSSPAAATRAGSPVPPPPSPHLAPLSWQAGGRRGAQPTPAAGGAGARRI